METIEIKDWQNDKYKLLRVIRSIPNQQTQLDGTRIFNICNDLYKQYSILNNDLQRNKFSSKIKRDIENLTKEYDDFMEIVMNEILIEKLTNG